MSEIFVDYAAMSTGHDGLVATWNRIEGHLSELNALAAATGSMQAETLTAYLALKTQWDAAAGERQLALKQLAASLAQISANYQQTDRTLAAQFAM
ncbi:WXG100 family type VII secretion target [Nakamurella aerolata]|uniref:WXG100 family type VII secretion target n=1 Tax=Nakamurella aerolata TaxID=1656892 RepID=A0A849A939_9ACTN|nr:hypothetical protein [Nakamurella aerolata]NNG35618.1 hypothetical protein [Nakamurella aerolata]